MDQNQVHEAGPELLKALKELLAVYTDDQEKGTAEWCARASRAEEQARQAIEKAEG